MLGFKEYALLTFDHSFTERIRNHFLKYVGSDLPLYLQDPVFLQKLTDKGGKKDKGIKYFIDQINEAGTIYFNLYNKFKGPQGIGSQINYYRLAAYYTKLNGLTYTKTQGGSLIVEADNAIKEIFAEKLYDYLLAISTAKTYEEKELTAKDIIKKTFVPDSSLIKQTKTYGGIEKDPIPSPTKSLLYDNATTTFEGRLFTVAHYECAAEVATPLYLQGCAGHSSDLCKGAFGCTEQQKTKTARLKKLVELYKQNDNIENTQFPDSDGFPYSLNSFKSNNLGLYKENQFYIDRFMPVEPGVTQMWYGKGLPTTNETTFMSLLSAGAHVEFFFKFNFDELAGHLTGAGAYEKGISNIFHKHHGYPLVDFVSSISTTDFSSPAGKGKYNAGLYYSLEKFSRLIRDIYLYVSRESWPTTPELMNNLPTEWEIDKAFESTKIEFGARLIVSTPNLSEETNSDKIMSVYKQFPEKYESSFDSENYADGSQNHGVTEASDKLLKDAEKYSEFDSAWKNKTFIYNFLSYIPKEQEYKISHDDGWGGSSLKDATQALNDLGVSTVYCFPIAEKSVELTKGNKKEFLLDFYAGIPRYMPPGIGADRAGMRDVDFSLDQAVVGKYSKFILDNLFDDALVDNFVNSILFGKQTSLSVEQYKSAAQLAGEPLFIENSKDRNSWITECNKTDDKIDQNLITLIDSIEGF